MNTNPWMAIIYIFGLRWAWILYLVSNWYLDGDFISFKFSSIGEKPDQTRRKKNTLSV